MGIWDRVKDVLLGSSVEDEQAAPARTFTAARIPTLPESPRPSAPPPPSERKWELYEDGWQHELAIKPAPLVPEHDLATLESLRDEGPGDLLDHLDDDEIEALVEVVQPQVAEPQVASPEPDGTDESAPRIAVYEQRLEAAAGRSRGGAAPHVQVHDERLEHPAPHKLLSPSEAMALAERGRGAIGPREDVGKAT